MNWLYRNEAVGLAHSKLILVGEHVVVYDKPAIAIPFPLKIIAKITNQPGEITFTSDLYHGNLNDMPANMQGLLECINRAFELCQKPREGVHIEVTSNIPIGRGLGSSAASATALVRGIYHYFHKDLSLEELFHLVGLAETYAHGKPSGIDMMAVASDAPIYYRKTIGASLFHVSKPFHIIVADTGKVGDTKKAVNHVREMKLRNPHVVDQIIDEIEEIVRKAKASILEGDTKQLGILLTRNHEKLKNLGVSDPFLDRLITSALNAGALGAKLTGGGMGGCIIALAKQKEHAVNVAKELKKCGAKKVWCFSNASEEIYFTE